MTHELKILPLFFDAVARGEKTFELRKNDRGFRVGDRLVLKEWNGKDYTGNEVTRVVNYILYDWGHGLQDGWCIMNLKNEQDGAIQPEQRWIPCKERLPEEDDMYLVTVHPRYIVPGGIQIDMLGWHEGKWYFQDIDGRDAVFPDPIIAWQPLPEPYQTDMRGEQIKDGQQC